MGAYKSPESFARVDIWFCLANLINPNCLKNLSQIMHNSSYLVSLLQILSLQYHQRRSQRRSTGTQIRMNPVSHRSRRNSSVAGAGGQSPNWLRLLGLAITTSYRNPYSMPQFGYNKTCNAKDSNWLDQ